MNQAIGYECLLLHAHLPFVRHPEWSDPFEELWLHEAITESYLPLLEIMEGWRRDGVDFRLTLSLSPPLVAMLRDPMLQERYSRRLAKLIDLASQEVVRTSWLPDYAPLAGFYLNRFQRCQHAYEGRYQRDLVNAFASFAATGNLELITCSATHAFLPLMQDEPEAIRAQIRLGVESFERELGTRPRGIWLAECGYFPGLEREIEAAGLDYFFVDAHGILYGDPRPINGVYAPVRCPSDHPMAGPAAFGRDLHTSNIVWSAKGGYPGDPWYREFYRDIGHDLELEYLTPFIHSTGRRVDTGLKYHRVTGDVALGDKSPYDPQKAKWRAQVHGEHFAGERAKQARKLARLMSQPPIVISPYDAELFGHWWYEGPQFLDAAMRSLILGGEVAPVTPTEYLIRHAELQIQTPSMSSWGERGYASQWLDSSNDWIYPLLHRAIERMTSLATRKRNEKDPYMRRALDQMARELLLAQSSDWAFILKSGAMADYARQRTETHCAALHALAGQIETGAIDRSELKRLEAKDNIFGEVRYERYAKSRG